MSTNNVYSTMQATPQKETKLKSRQMAQQLRAQTVFHGLQLSSVLSTHTTACNLRSRGSSVLSWPLWHCTHSETYMWTHTHTHKNNWKSETKHWLLNNSEDHARIKCKIITHGKNSKRTFRNILRCLKKNYCITIILPFSFPPSKYSHVTPLAHFQIHDLFFL